MQIIETSRHLFLVMEYVEQGELFDYIVKQSKLEEVEACRFFKNIISGVAYLHELSIVHRDLKP
jgi:5'-AMP-activated protein kinase, catalytic alpha subunit